MDTPRTLIETVNRNRLEDARRDGTPQSEVELLPAVVPDAPEIDNTDGLSRILTYAAIRDIPLLLDGLYHCAGEPRVRTGVRVALDCEHPYSGGIQLVGDPDVRRRATLRVDWAAVDLGPIVLGGVMPHEGGTDKSPREKEAQPALWCASCQGVKLCRTRLAYPRGDFLYFGVADPNDQVPNRDVELYGIDTLRGGRAGFVFNAVENLKAHGGTIGPCGASIIDFEASEAAGSFRNIWIEGWEIDDPTGLFAHLHQYGDLEDVTFFRIVRHGAPVAIDCIPNYPNRFRGLHVLGCWWDRPQSGGHFARFWHCDGVEYRGNEGPYSRIRSAGEPSFRDSTNVAYNPALNKLTPV